MIVSGRMRARTPEEDTNVRRVEAYFGTDAGLFDDHWPVSHVGVASPPPVVFMPLYHQTSVIAHMKTAASARPRHARGNRGLGLLIMRKKQACALGIAAIGQ